MEVYESVGQKYQKKQQKTNTIYPFYECIDLPNKKDEKCVF